MKCRIKNCSSQTIAKGLCGAHYKRRRTTGSAQPDIPVKPKGHAIKWLKAHVGFGGRNCLIWPFNVDKRGYGRVSFRGTVIYASRVMCFLAHGDPPTKDHQAAHSCNNRKCVNPKHIRWATPKENAADMIGHGTRMRGEKIAQAKLTAQAVLQIREMRHSGHTLQFISDQFHVHRETIRNAVLRKTWSHI